MGTPNKWQYCEVTTLNHPIAEQHSNCVQLLDVITKQESDKKIKTPFFSQRALNLDEVEIIKHKAARNSTMDIAFGIKMNKKKKQYLLCEYKLNCKNIGGIKETDLLKKIKGAIVLLGQEIPIHSKYFFVFKTKIKQQAIRKLRRFGNNKKVFIALDIQDLYERYFAVDANDTF